MWWNDNDFELGLGLGLGLVIVLWHKVISWDKALIYAYMYTRKTYERIA